MGKSDGWRRARSSTLLVPGQHTANVWSTQQRSLAVAGHLYATGDRNWSSIKPPGCTSTNPVRTWWENSGIRHLMFYFSYYNQHVPNFDLTSRRPKVLLNSLFLYGLVPITSSSQTVEHLVDGSVQRLDLILDTQREEGKKQRRNKRTDASHWLFWKILRGLKRWKYPVFPQE